MGSGKSKLFKEIHKTAKKYAKQKVISFSSIYDGTSPPKTVHSRDSDAELLRIDYDVKSLGEVIFHVKEHMDPINLQLSQIEAEFIARGNISIEKFEKKKSLQRQKNIIVLVDEVHFLDKDVTYREIRRYCQKIVELADQGPQFIFFGLDLTWERLPWKTTSMLMAIAKVIDKRTAICRFCLKSGSHYTKCTHPELLNGSYIKNDDEIDARKDIFFPACEKCLSDPAKTEPIKIEDDEEYRDIVNSSQLVEKYDLAIN